MTARDRSSRPQSDPATLETIERRRSELLGVTFLILVLLAVGTVVVSFAGEGGSWLAGFGGTENVLRGSLVALCLAFAGYVLDKERRLRRMATDLMNERVLSAALENRLREIAYLTDAGKAVFSSLELEEVLQTILDASFELLGAHEGSIMLVEGEELLVAAVSGHAGAFIGARYPTDRTIAGEAIRTRTTVRITGTDDRAPRPLRRGHEASSSMSVPLLASGKAMGALNLSRRPGAPPFEDYDVEAVERFAAHAALALRNARAYGKDKPMDAFSAGAARNLESSLATILGTVGLLAGDVEGVDRRHRETLESVGRRAEGLLVEMEGLLDRAHPLPAGSRSDEPIADPGAEHPPHHATGKARVLVADDDPALLRLCGFGLERYGHDVTLASDGATALRRIEQERPDVVVLDLVMPAVDGWRVLERLAGRAASPRVIIVSGRLREGDRLRARELGAHEVLAKPFTVEELERRVREAVGGPQALAAGPPGDTEMGPEEAGR